MKVNYWKLKSQWGSWNHGGGPGIYKFYTILTLQKLQMEKKYEKIYTESSQSQTQHL
jgi:hypothetical protein